MKISTDVKGGCGCLGLIMGLDLKAKSGEDLKNFDQLIYPKLITSIVLPEKLDLLLERGDEIQPENILLIKINNWPQHMAVVIEVKPHIVIIHSYLQARKMVKQHLREGWEVARAYYSSELSPAKFNSTSGEGHILSVAQ